MVGHDELKQPRKGVMDFIENDIKATKGGGYDTSKMAKEAESDPTIKSHKVEDDGRGIKPTHDLGTTTNMAMDLSGDQGFANGKTSANSVTYPEEPKIHRDRDVVPQQKTDAQNSKALDEYKLVKDIEEMKLKVNALESKLKQVWL